jgi:hypothetical protein
MEPNLAGSIYVRSSIKLPHLVVGRKNILFKKILLASFYRGHILTSIVLAQKWPKKL